MELPFHYAIQASLLDRFCFTTLTTEADGVQMRHPIWYLSHKAHRESKTPVLFPNDVHMGLEVA